MSINTKFLDQVIALAGRKVGYAVERNMPLVLQDIERQRQLFGDDADDAERVEMSVKVDVRHPSEQHFRIEVSSVTWATKFRRVDKDFEPGEIDIDRPYLPGLSDVMAGAPAKQSPYANRQEENFFLAARDLGKRVFRACRDKANPNHARSIDEWDWEEEKWKTSLCEDASQAADALKAAVTLENLVLSAQGDIHHQSALLLLDAGYEICQLYHEPYEVWEWRSPDGAVNTFDKDTLPAKYRDITAYRDGGGLESPLYQP